MMPVNLSAVRLTITLLIALLFGINDALSESEVNSPPGKIIRSQLTTAIVNREPTDDVVMLTNNSEKIYYFTELSDLNGHKITHRWEHNGQVMAEINFKVKSDRWRVFSSKIIKPDWTGNWSVSLIDENGSSLKVSNFEVVDSKTN